MMASSIGSNPPKVLGITLARGGSKGVLGKNIRALNGKPLLAYTIEEAKKCIGLTDYIVSTDSAEIAKVAMDYGVKVPFLRPKELALDTTTSVAALQHAVQEMERISGLQYDYVVELMATNPFKTSADIDRAIEILVSSRADSVIAVRRVEDGHPARLKKIVDGRLVDFCVPEILESRRQDLKPHAFIRCGAIYALSRKELMVEGRRYGSDNSLALELESKLSVNIDQELDFVLAESILRGR